MSHDSETEEFKAVVRDMYMTREERRYFHDYLTDHYWDEKDFMDYNRLMEVAHECLGR